jgi:hypothetical protein
MGDRPASKRWDVTGRRSVTGSTNLFQRGEGPRKKVVDESRRAVGGHVWERGGRSRGGRSSMKDRVVYIVHLVDKL